MTRAGIRRRIAVKVPLTRGYTALVSEEDATAVLAYRWRAACIRPGVVYAVRAVPSGLQRPRQRALYLHTFLTGFSRTDHVDGDGLNNCRENLREATVAQNNYNRRAQLAVSSQYKGVSLNRGRGKRWKAGIKVNGKSRHLGYYDDEAAAARAYDKAARAEFGDFAALNFPEPGKRSGRAAQ